MDENADDRVSPAEYRQMIEAWTGRETDASDAFEPLDLNHDGYLSRSEFAEHWTRFWAGDNRDAAGSWVFGTLPTGAGHR